MMAICHCTDCQHEGGSFSDSAVFPPGTLKYTEGEPTKYEQSGASGKNVEHYFCGKCGSTLVIMQDVLVIICQSSLLIRLERSYYRQSWIILRSW